MAKTTPQDTATTVEYQLWYDAIDGARRSLNALDMGAVTQHISDLAADEERRQLLAESVGLSADPHDYNFSCTKVTTTTEPAELPQ